MALAGVQRSYNFPGEDMSRSTAQPWVLGWISHDHTCASGYHRLPVTCQSQKLEGSLRPVPFAGIEAHCSGLSTFTLLIKLHSLNRASAAWPEDAAEAGEHPLV